MHRETKPGFFSRFKKRKPETEEGNEETRTRNQETAM